MYNLRIKGREFTVSGPNPTYGSYILTGARGAAYVAMPFQDAPDRYFVIGGLGRGVPRDLYIDGNRVILRRDGEELVAA